jgi:Type IV pilin-like G and H, putative
MRQLSSIALLLTLSSTSMIAPNFVIPSYAQTTPAPGANQTDQKILGTWEMNQNGFSLTFIFAPENKLYIVSPLDPRSPQRTATELRYKINSVPKPMHLDVFLPRTNKPVETIFEYTADGKMRMQLEGTNPGSPRPPKFRDNGTIFSKTSEATTLPEGVELISYPGSNAAEVPKPQMYVMAIVRGQQAHFLEKSKFSTNLKDLELGIPSDDAEYSYQIQQPTGRPQRVFITANPKKPNLPSYIGAVFVTNVNKEAVTISGICRKDKATKKQPVMPILSLSTNKVTCPADSTTVEG